MKKLLSCLAFLAAFVFMFSACETAEQEKARVLAQVYSEASANDPLSPENTVGVDMDAMAKRAIAKHSKKVVKQGRAVQQGNAIPQGIVRGAEYYSGMYGAVLVKRQAERMYGSNRAGYSGYHFKCTHRSRGPGFSGPLELKFCTGDMHKAMYLGREYYCQKYANNMRSNARSHFVGCGKRVDCQVVAHKGVCFIKPGKL